MAKVKAPDVEVERELVVERVGQGQWAIWDSTAPQDDGSQGWRTVGREPEAIKEARAIAKAAGVVTRMRVIGQGRKEKYSRVYNVPKATRSTGAKAKAATTHAAPPPLPGEQVVPDGDASTEGTVGPETPFGDLAPEGDPPTIEPAPPQAPPDEGWRGEIPEPVPVDVGVHPEDADRPAPEPEPAEPIRMGTATVNITPVIGRAIFGGDQPLALLPLDVGTDFAVDLASVTGVLRGLREGFTRIFFPGGDQMVRGDFWDVVQRVNAARAGGDAIADDGEEADWARWDG